MSTIRFRGEVNAYIDWEEIDTNQGIAIMSDLGTVDSIEWAYGTGNGYVANDPYYIEETLSPGESFSVDFEALPRYIFGLMLTRGWQRLKLLCIENVNASGTLCIGHSGTSEPVGLFSYDTEIGPSGVYTMHTSIGIDIDSTHHNIQIVNISDSDTKFKLLALGVKSG